MSVTLGARLGIGLQAVHKIAPGIVHIKSYLKPEVQIALSNRTLEIGSVPIDGFWNGHKVLNRTRYCGTICRNIAYFQTIPALHSESLELASQVDSSVKRIPAKLVLLNYYETLEQPPS